MEKVLVIEDSFGRFSLGLWGDHANEPLIQAILDAISPFGASLFWAPSEGGFDPLELDASWKEARWIDSEGDDDRIRIVVRHRMLPAWQTVRKTPLWKASEGPRMAAFYSFKGGMGRTTALAAFALERTRHDEHIVVVDLDLDAPGLGSLFFAAPQPPYGVVDYLIESPVLGHRPDDLLDYSWRFPLDGIRTSGSLRVLPAGKLDQNYLGKMARLDFETSDEIVHPLETLLSHIREAWNPDWILLDSRTGFSETAGMLLSGLAHFHVLVGVDSEQSWQGLAYAVRKLGAERLMRDLPQAEAMIVQGLVPNRTEFREESKRSFKERSTDLFKEAYYSSSEDGGRDDDFWYLDDASIPGSPDAPTFLSYQEELAQSASIANLVESLSDEKSGYPGFCRELAGRVERLS